MSESRTRGPADSGHGGSLRERALSQHAARAAGWCAVLFVVWVGACVAPRAEHGSASSSPPAASAHPSTVDDAGDSSARAPQSAAATVPAQAGGTWLTLHVRDARTHEPIGGVTIARARAKTWDTLSTDLDATWARLGISGSAPSWLGLTREEALPSEPGTQDAAPFAPEGESIAATTDRAGRAKLTSKLPDDEFLVIRCAGRGPRYVSVTELGNRAELDVDLHPLAKLTVRVRTLAGEPIEDAYLRIEAMPFLPEYRPQVARPLVDGLAWHGPTDAEGKFELTELFCDESLIVTPLSRCIGKSATVVLTPGALESSCELIVVEPGGISGRIVGLDGEPVAGAQLDCMPRRPWYSMSASTRTDAEGDFSLNSLPSGLQSLSCTPGYEGGYRILSDHPFEVQVEPFSRTDVGELVFGENASCAVRIVGLPHDLEGEFNRWRLELTQGRTRFTNYRVAPDGSFHFSAQQGPAKVQLILATDWAAGRPILARTVTLPCENVELDVTSLLATLAFRLDPGTDAELASATLYDHELDEHDGTPAWEGALSRFDFDRDGERYLVKTLLPGRFRLELQVKGGARGWSGEVELEAGKTRDLGILAPGTAKLSGTLAGAPPGSVVDLERRVPGMFGKGAFGDERFDHRTASVAADGSFLLDELPADLWSATATAAGAAIVDPVLVDLRVGDSKTIALRASAIGAVRCHVRRGSIPVAGAVLTYSFAREESLRPFFELNPRLQLLPSGTDGLIELKTLFPGPYRIEVELGDRRLGRMIQRVWGEQLDLDFDFGAPEFTVDVDVPESLLADLWMLDYRVPDDGGPNAGLRVAATRTGPRTFALRAPVSTGYAVLSFLHDLEGGTVFMPLALRADHREVVLTLPPGEMVVRVGSEMEHWFPPEVQVVEMQGASLRGLNNWFSTLPMEQLADDRWLVRGISPGSTVRIQPGDQRERFGPPARFVRFESGRLEVSWP